MNQTSSITMLQLKCFINLYELRRYDIAASRVFITNSTFSKHISNLEGLLGTQLFQPLIGRTPGSVTVVNLPSSDELYQVAKEMVFVSSTVKLDRLKIDSFYFIIYLSYLKNMRLLSRELNKNISFVMGHVNHIEKNAQTTLFKRYVGRNKSMILKIEAYYHIKCALKIVKLFESSSLMYKNKGELL
ncbi:LysR family transcriptional regulator [Pectobacterium brasiliense]|uniref:helix-turn-helix domain-containing protein n=1 Tax=Pectobacterium TaxID=122277 RepID=UPI0019698A99|nr:LysR family transcriptional regulator [Pectobacterium brasiliense]MBN3099953.1 LysR family transcriptional regulator [Pectobacterium brasiliense]MBN3166588.1 LysR family transcriptional regulator [Pectobacterium brasiliense]